MAEKSKPTKNADTGNEPTITAGPFFYSNLLNEKAGEPAYGGFEVTLFTDARATGSLEDDSRPYSFFNLVPADIISARLKPAICFRSASHLPPAATQLPKMEKTNEEHFTGGHLYDEIAALLSLCLGIRVRSSGGPNRLFQNDQDLRGKPISWYWEEIPTLTINAKRARVLPSALGPAKLGDATRILKSAILRPIEATALVRSASLYASAVWVVEADPNQSWLNMVSAVETAANIWHKGGEDPVDLLRDGLPDVFGILNDCDADLPERIAPLLVNRIGATKKFRDFLQAFSPKPPDSRPPTGMQFDYDPKNAKKAFNTIYGYRSRALHSGVPFPPPMYDPPWKAKRDDQFSEIPLGLASSSHGAVWARKDTPMTLHTFEYIARNALLSWWDSLL